LTQATPVEEVLREAMLAHRSGHLLEAEAGYHEVLRWHPDEPKALYYLGLLQFHRGDRDGGIKHVVRSLRGDPGNARAWSDLGGMFIAIGWAADAKEAYRRATEAAPENAQGWYNLGICQRNENEFADAIASLREAIAREPDYSQAYEVLGTLFYQLGRVTDAAGVYTAWSVREPSNAKASHMAAAMSGQVAPTRASDEYVRQVFDESASSFDVSLERLEYRAPQAIAEALAQRPDKGGGASAQQAGADGLGQLAGRNRAAVLDAGCGTGLCGPLLRRLSSHLVGVDLSPKMIERAQARKCYDELVTSELTLFLHGRPLAFDAVVSADTLVYFGALEQVFAAAHVSLRDGGWLVFTLEALDANTADDHRLQVHGRYAHSEKYVRDGLSAAGFQLEALSMDSFRKERDQEVPGFLVVARRN
jgi:predicted TPR repeat methyltransferase